MQGIRTTCGVRADVGIDRSIWEVQLEDADTLSVMTGSDRHVDLYGLRTNRSAVVVVGVKVGQALDNLAPSRVQRLILGFLPEARPVVGEHHPPGQVA